MILDKAPPQNACKTTTIYLLRHGKVSGPPALYGKTDIEVSDEINQQIVNDLNTFQTNSSAKINQVISSPLQRCKKVAKQFSNVNALPYKTISDFQEMNFGKLDGISFDAIRDSEKDDEIWQQLEKFWQDPNSYPLPEAELLTQFYQRVELAWKQILAAHIGENILLVCHGGVIRIILSLVLNIDHGNQALFSQLTIKNSSITIIKNVLLEQSIHSNVVAISAPLTCLSQNPEEFK